MQSLWCQKQGLSERGIIFMWKFARNKKSHAQLPNVRNSGIRVARPYLGASVHTSARTCHRENPERRNVRTAYDRTAEGAFLTEV